MMTLVRALVGRGSGGDMDVGDDSGRGLCR